MEMCKKKLKNYFSTAPLIKMSSKKKLNLSLKDERPKLVIPTTSNRSRQTATAATRDLSALNRSFSAFTDQVESLLLTQETGEQRLNLMNHLLRYSQQLNALIGQVDEGDESIGDLLNSVSQTQQNRNYEINNEITLLNFGDSRVNSIVELFSDSEFINHIIRKDKFLNKYTVIVYDSKWDTKAPSPAEVPGGDFVSYRTNQ